MSKTATVPMLVGMLALLATPQGAPAKGRTVKLIVMSRNLPGPLEITDPRILELSNVWGRQFLDRSYLLEAKPLREWMPHQLSFYVRFGNEEPKMLYVAYYYPEKSNKRGFIYVPGEREPWYYHNEAAIGGSGHDGTWSYASAAWEDLIKPVIVRAVEQRRKP